MVVWQEIPPSHTNVWKCVVPKNTSPQKDWKFQGEGGKFVKFPSEDGGAPKGQQRNLQRNSARS